MQHTEIVIDQQYHGLNPIHFGYDNCLPTQAFGPAVRRYWLLHYVVSGFGTFEYDGVSYHVGPGKIFVIPPFEKTYYYANPEKPWSYIWIAFSTEEELPSLLSQPVFNCPGAGEYFEEMKKCRHWENGRSAFLSACLWKLMAFLWEQDKPAYDYIDMALSYIHAEYTNPITIQEIANQVNLDRCYFSTAFTKRVGSSPQQYLVNLRLTKAAELMVQYGETPTTAAASVGYTDPYQFSKIFKQHFGVSPRTYIKEHSTPKKKL